MGEEPGLRGMQGEKGDGKEDAEVQKTRYNGRQEHKASREYATKDAYGKDVDKELCFCDREVTERKEQVGFH